MQNIWRRGSSTLSRIAFVLVSLGLGVLAIFLPLLVMIFPKYFDRIVGWAGILGFSAAAFGGALALIGRGRVAGQVTTERLEEAVDWLRRQVYSQESDQRAQLLGAGRTGAVAANLRFVRGHTRSAGDPANAGTLETVADFFVHLDQRRLVVLGDAGSGKTVLAVELLIQVLDQHDPAGDARSWTSRSVPVRFGLSRWHKGWSLARWLADELVARFGLRYEVARALVDDRRILPVLDGLDEMDPPGVAPIRAAAAVSQLNAFLRGRDGAPMVVTCRTGTYEYLRATAGVVVQPAAEVTIQPLQPAQIRQYLDEEFGAPLERSQRAEWDRLLDRLDGGGDRQLLAAMQTPWRLALAVTYQRDGGDICRLLAASTEADDVYSVLLAAFIPARTRLYGADGLTPAGVARWCRILAAHMGERSAIVLHEWWPVAGSRRIRRWHAAAAVAVTELLGLIACLLNNGVTGVYHALGAVIPLYHRSAELHPVPSGRLEFAWLAVVLLGFPLLALLQARRSTRVPTQSNPQQLRTRRGRRQFARWFTVGLAFTVPVAVFFGYVEYSRSGLARGLTNALTVAFASGLSFSLSYGLRPIGEVAAGPRDLIRNDLTVWLASGLAVGLGYGLPLGAVAVIPSGPAGGFLLGVAGGLIVTFALGLAGHAWLRYVLTVGLMWRRERMPLRFGRFLDWACEAGILRTAGNSYQFRHVGLYEWLRASAACPRQQIPADTEENESNFPV